jgi:hypothetical protein
MPCTFTHLILSAIWLIQELICGGTNQIKGGANGILGARRFPCRIIVVCVCVWCVGGVCTFDSQPCFSLSYLKNRDNGYNTSTNFIILYVGKGK